MFERGDPIIAGTPCHSIAYLTHDQISKSIGLEGFLPVHDR